VAIRKAQIGSRIAHEIFAICLILSVVLHGAADAQSPRRDNTWAARSSTGLTVGGTWTVIEQLKTGGITRTWTLLNAQGRIAATGGWSAAKTPGGWTGSWRAATAGRRREYTGTWTAKVDLKPTGTFAELFAKAVESAVSGTWRSGPQSGAWTIQVFN